MRKSEVELLSPAGSFETLLAVMKAGADAVYIGGDKFSARAYATNFDKDNVLRAIDIGHINDKKVVLAVNTLMKNKEIENELYDYILPYYEAGLEAVIVQDIGVVSFIRKYFPNLPVHASTQMTLCSEYGVKFMRDLGVTRCVLARELSLDEIRRIHEVSPETELECFVHGALCYSYSGQCLMSSILGGRSGNRGRCAGPCRLNYDVFENGKKINGRDEEYPLSLKDLKAINLLPDLIEAGVYSFKLEGRMKSSEYAAGVVSIYRKYIDKYFECGREKYQVLKEDDKKLYSLGNRCGFTEGYFNEKNGRDMVTLKRPNHTKDDEEDVKADEKSTLKKNLSATVSVLKGEPLMITLTDGEIYQTECGNIVDEAKSKAVTEDVIADKVKSSGDDFVNIANAEIVLGENLFVSMSELKQLRRKAIASYKKTFFKEYKRTDAKAYGKDFVTDRNIKIQDPKVSVSVLNIDQLKALEGERADRVYLDSFILNEDTEKVQDIVSRLKDEGKEIYFSLPFDVRKEYFNKLDFFVDSLSADGYLTGSYDGLRFLEEKGISKDRIVLDHSIYSFSNISVVALANLGYKNLTVPYELNRGEIAHRYNNGSEMLIYGRIPLMTSAGCINKTYRGCDKKAHYYGLKDRYGIMFPVKNNCAFCYNVLYNSRALNLLKEIDTLKDLGVAAVRMSFTTESGDEIKMILNGFYEGKEVKGEEEFTLGHFKRGVE
ncbi:MAG: U32 family peptidase [Lachnospiraceae bacterium]|nr:U32 family peptidase [Lachnospiraceae bacterium]